MGTTEVSWWLQGWWANMYSIHNWTHFGSLLSRWLQGVKVYLSRRSELIYIWRPWIFSGSNQSFVFLVKALFCMWVLVWYFGLILRSDCFNWSWLKMPLAQFFWEEATLNGTLLVFQPLAYLEALSSGDWLKKKGQVLQDQTISLRLVETGLKSVWVESFDLFKDWFFSLEEKPLRRRDPSYLNILTPPRHF